MKSRDLTTVKVKRSKLFIHTVCCETQMDILLPTKEQEERKGELVQAASSIRYERTERNIHFCDCISGMHM